MKTLSPLSVVICLAALGNVAGASTVFDYGVATRGPIILWGNARILSANNDPTEASVLTSSGTSVAVSMAQHGPNAHARA